MRRQGENHVLSVLRWAITSPSVAEAAGISATSWPSHVFEHYPDNVGPANNGRLPYVVITGVDENYAHETAAPRGGTRTSTFTVAVHVRGFPSQMRRHVQFTTNILNACMREIRLADELVIGDEQRAAAERRPYGFVVTSTITIETSFGPDYEVCTP